jgi:hypothetical protein
MCHSFFCFFFFNPQSYPSIENAEVWRIGGGLSCSGQLVLARIRQ